jgi:iron(III) transport system ATP-binding protein
MASVSVSGLVKEFEGEVRAVKGISFEVADGELLTLLGPSGCGKTTTLRLIAGLETPDEGQIRFGERVVTDADRGVFVPPERRGAGMVFQSYAIWPHMSVYANVAYPLRMQRTDSKLTRKRVDAALELVGLLELSGRMATHLSGGQQQRTAIARAIVAEPSLLLLDEPLSNLDARLRAQMRAEIRALQQTLGITTLYVTHDQAEAMVLSDRVVVMDSGRVQQLGKPREVYHAPANRFVAEFVGFDNFLQGSVVSLQDGILTARVGRGGSTVACPARPGFAVGDAVILAARSVHVGIGPETATGPNVIGGEVQQSLYYGDVMEYRVDAGGDHLVASVRDRHPDDPSGATYLAGQRVSLRVDPAWTVPLGAG